VCSFDNAGANLRCSCQDRSTGGKSAEPAQEVNDMADMSKSRGGSRSGHRGPSRGGYSGPSSAPRTAAPARPQEPKVIELPDSIALRDLAVKINVSPINIIRELMQNGMMATINQQLDFDTAAIALAAFGWEAKAIPILVESAIPDEIIITGGDGKPKPRQATLKQRLLAKEQAENAAGLMMRPPVVTIMGHVDHGKTSLLDAIRKSNVAEGEAGGITQHIGAYMVDHGGKKVTFLDTPGHEAFTQMRARGAQVTDVAVLVVAADDGVMPQTKEAVAHAKAAQVPIVVAVTKVDKSNANPLRVKQEMMEIGVVPDEFGGDTMFVEVSARQKKGIDDLLEGILLTAESLETIKANPSKRAVATVIEAELSKSKGPMATVLVQNGTLHVGDAFVVGTVSGRVRAMFDFRGQNVKKAAPSVPVSITGMSDVPAAGDVLEVVDDEKAARALAAQNLASRGGSQGAQRAVSLDQYFAMAKASKTKKLYLIVKSDSQGSLPPIIESLNKLNSSLNAENKDDEVRLDIILQSTGAITESDIELAIASGAVVLGFEVTLDTAARKKAESNGIDVRLYDVIYKLLEDVEMAMKGMLAPKIVERVIGSAEVKQVFRIPKIGAIAGVSVRSGVAQRNVRARVLRGGQPIHTGTVGSLKRLTEDVKEVRQGYECGVAVDGFTEYKPGDIIEFVVQEEQAR
jgi:translation initiation factor IF-2